jgi:hypothetical protein
MNRPRARRRQIAEKVQRRHDHAFRRTGDDLRWERRHAEGGRRQRGYVDELCAANTGDGISGGKNRGDGVGLGLEQGRTEGMRAGVGGRERVVAGQHRLCIEAACAKVDRTCIARHEIAEWVLRGNRKSEVRPGGDGRGCREGILGRLRGDDDDRRRNAGQGGGEGGQPCRYPPGARMSTCRSGQASKVVVISPDQPAWIRGERAFKRLTCRHHHRLRCGGDRDRRVGGGH